eukprot:44330-Amphidinium_carterae.1
MKEPGESDCTRSHSCTRELKLHRRSDLPSGPSLQLPVCVHRENFDSKHIRAAEEELLVLVLKRPLLIQLGDKWGFLGSAWGTKK